MRLIRSLGFRVSTENEPIPPANLLAGHPARRALRQGEKFQGVLGHISREARLEEKGTTAAHRKARERNQGLTERELIGGALPIANLCRGSGLLPEK
jgi:hypothetical protein